MLQRFHDAQAGGEGPSYEQALAELRAGGKRSHWIWYVLPQLRGLGRSDLAERYAIRDLEEARAYLADPLLRGRLEAVIGVIAAQLDQPGQSLDRLMGGDLDATKTVSCLTLFAEAGLPQADALLLRIGRRCQATLAALKR